jgi:hypothetical protein
MQRIQTLESLTFFCPASDDQRAAEVRAFTWRAPGEGTRLSLLAKLRAARRRSHKLHPSAGAALNAS